MKLKTISEHVQLEVKGLALLRVSLSLIWIYSIVARLIYFDSFYASDSLLPLGTARSISDNTDTLGLIFYWDNNYFTHSLFALSLLNAVVLLVGYKPRLFSLIAFILMLFLDSRNQFVLNAGYETLRVLMFWLIFLPSNFQFSLKKPQNLSKSQISGWLALGFLLQIVCFYFFGGVFKNSDYWKLTGEALEMAFSNRVMSYSWVQSLLPTSDWLQSLSRLVYYYELSIGLLLLGFFSYTKIRKLVLILLIFFHLGIFVSFKIGFLPLVNIAALWALWPFKKIEDQKPEKPFFKTGAVLTAFLLLINFNSVPWWPKLPQSLFAVSRAILMDQTWMFFAPHPYSFDGWWRLTEKISDGVSQEIRITGEKIEPNSETFYTQSVSMEEKTFLIHLLKENFSDFRKEVLYKLCKTQKTNEVNFEFIAADLPATNKKLTYSTRISESITCNN
jgi:hypothetical protein